MSLYLLTLLRHKCTSPKEESLVTSLRSTSSKDVWKPSSPFARPSASAPKSFKSGRMSSWYEVLRRRLQKIREQKEPIRKLWIGFNSYFTSCYGTLFPLTNERYQPIKLPCLTSPLASPCPIHSDTLPKVKSSVILQLHVFESEHLKGKTFCKEPAMSVRVMKCDISCYFMMHLWRFIWVYLILVLGLQASRIPLWR